VNHNQTFTSLFKPLLAAPADLAKLSFPLIASPKVDGIRCICHPILGPVSRSLKPIPNRAIKAELSKPEYRYFDGEIVVGDPANTLTFNRTTAIMSSTGELDWHYLVFDHIEHSLLPYFERLKRIKIDVVSSRAKILPATQINNEIELNSIEEHFLCLGYEGVMLRSLTGRYKFGRSTQKEGILLKLKRFLDDDAIIIGFEELMQNDNPQERSELGYAKRSAALAGLVPANKLGALIVYHPEWNKFNLGSGFTDIQRVEFWQKRTSLLGTFATFKYQSHGMLNKPRTPIFLRLRPVE
jgi:DNA ligase 1